MHRRLALVRRPSPAIAAGLVTHLERSPVNAQLAARQWAEYCSALERRGWSLVQAPPVDECPDGVFIEDQVFVHGDVAVLCRSGAAGRRSERAGLRDVLESAGYRCVVIDGPATLDGGDVLKWGPRVWVGVGGRTNAPGVEQLRAALDSQRVTVTPVPLVGVLHLKSAVTALPDGTVLVHDASALDVSAFDRVLSVPEEAGAHVVLLGGMSLLMSAAAPRTAQQLRSLGHDVTVVDISELEKLEGCVTCLSVRLRG